MKYLVKHSGVIIILFCFTLLGYNMSSLSEASINNDIMRLKVTTIMDTNGWERPVPAKSLLIPADWRTQGGVKWRLTTCPTDLITDNFLATSRDGKIAFETLPGFSWEWGDNQIAQTGIMMRGQCNLAPPKGPEQVLQDIVSAYRRGASVRTVERSYEAAQGVRNEIYRLYGYLLNAQGISVRTDAIRAVLDYQYEGKNYEEWITFSWVEAYTPITMSRTYWIRDIAAFRAPRGHLQYYERLFSAILSSARSNPAWESAIMRIHANVSIQGSIAAGNRAAIWRDAQNEIGDIRIRTWQISDKIHNTAAASWSRAFRGVDQYTDPETGYRVELPTGYRSAWNNGKGVYVLSSNPSFNPHTDIRFKNENWNRLRQNQ